MRGYLTGILLLALALGAPGRAAETYDLIFKNGTLDGLPGDHTLVYSKTVDLPLDAEAAARETGEVRLTFEAEDMARLRFHQNGKHRNIGQFPATVGNPMIMYFVETVVRDLAKHAGGSPFYIRNRVKDSLIQFAEIETRDMPFGTDTVKVQSITLHPFRKDPNRDRMRGFEDVALTISMSEAVEGWYYALRAATPSKPGAAVYDYTITLEPGAAK